VLEGERERERERAGTLQDIVKEGRAVKNRERD
jgi:hypothetical protein